MQKTLYCTTREDILKEQYLQDFYKHDYGHNDAFFVMQNVFVQDRIKDVCASSGDLAALAKNIIAKELKQVTVIEENVQKLLVESLIKTLFAKQQLEFFSKVNSFENLAKDILAFFQELRAQAVDAQNFYQVLEGFTGTDELIDKDKELLILYIAYNKILQEKNFFDKNSLLQLATRLLEQKTAVVGFKKLYICTYHSFSQIELDFICQLSKACNVDIALEYAKGDNSAFVITKSTYEQLLGVGFEAVFVECDKEHLIAKISASLFGENRNFLLPTDDISFKTHAFRRQEVQDVVASVKKHLNNGVEPKDIALVIRNLSFYPALRREFVVSGVQVCLPDVSRLSLQALARFVDGFLTLNFDVRQGFDKLLSCFLLEDKIDADRVKKALSKAVFYNFNQAIEVLNKAFYDDKKHLEFFSWLKKSFFALPKKATVAQFEKQIQDFLESFDIVKCIGDKYKKSLIDLEQLKLLTACYKSILECLQKITQDYLLVQEAEDILTAKQYHILLVDYFKKTNVLLARAEFNTVKVLAAHQVSCLKFDYVYILGLKDGEFPQKSKASWLYTQTQRVYLQSLGLLKDINLDRQLEQLFFYQAIAMCEKKLYLSANITDGEVLSPFFEEVKELFVQAKVEKRLPFEVLPGIDNLHNKEVLANFLLANKNNDNDFLHNYLKQDFFERIVCDVPQRQGVYAGNLVTLQNNLAKVFNKGFSPSHLESYAFCKFKFLLELIWQPDSFVSAKEDMPSDIKGNFYHECLRIFLHNYIEVGFSNSSLQQLQEKLAEVFADLKTKYQKRADFNQSYLTEYEFDKMLFYLENWLKAEYFYQTSQAKNFVPTNLEWQFGYDNDFTFATKFGNVAVRGRIDRIDSDGEHFFVTDYKSKNMPNKKQITTGLDLQMPVYFLAVAKLIGSCLGGNYFSVELAQRDGGFWLSQAKGNLDFIGVLPKETQEFECLKQTFTDNIVNLLDGILSGDFACCPATGECPSYCIGQGICRYRESLCKGKIQDE